MMYEYNVHYITLKKNNPAGLESELNEYGKEGWLLAYMAKVTIVKGSVSFMCVFVRELAS